MPLQLTYEHRQLLEKGDAGVPMPVEDPLAASDVHPLCKPRENEWVDPEHWEAKKRWRFPQPAHPLSMLLQNLRLPKWWEDREYALCAVRLTSTADGSSLGTIGALDLEALRTLSAPSPFGRGTETIFDETVRKGFEVTASQMHIVKETNWSDKMERSPGRTRDPFVVIARDIQQHLFPGRPVKLVFYKLALYEPGGHFKLHCDSTHTDSHHGTLLLGCDLKGTEDRYEGGQLILCSGDEERLFRLVGGSVFAFYTDVRHAVAPVKSGTKATLQFDVYLEDATIERDHTVACIPGAPDAPLARALGQLRVEAKPRCTSCIDGYHLYGCEHAESEDQAAEGAAVPASPDAVLPHPADLLREFVANLTALLRRGRDERAVPCAVEDDNAVTPRTMVFMLQHLYRRHSIQPSYLKGADSALYRALITTDELSVALHPVTYEKGTYTDWINGETEEQRFELLSVCKPFMSPEEPTFEEPVLVLDSVGDCKHIYAEGIETGNDSVGELHKYFAGAMFVTLAQSWHVGYVE